MEQGEGQRMEAVARRAKRGFNLIEAAIVLGVVGLVIGSIWVGARDVSQRNRANSFISDVGLIAMDIKSNFKSVTLVQPSWVMQKYLVARGYYPDPQNEFGSSAYSEPRLGKGAIISWVWYPTGTATPSGLDINANGVEKSVCRYITGKLSGFMEPFTFLGSTISVQFMVDSVISDCESTGHLMIRLNAIK